MKMKKMFMKMPDVLKGPILRNQISIDESKLDGTTFEIADTIQKLENAYRLLHDVYVEEGYMAPHPSGMRITHHSLLPKTTTFVGTHYEQIVLTMTLFPDSEAGLPMDSQFSRELDELRMAGRYIAEVGSLASDPGFRNRNQNVPMHANKIMHAYADKYLNLDDFVIAINPKHKWFYKNILLFEQISRQRDYGYVKGAPAIVMRMNIKKMEQRFRKTYSRAVPRLPRDLHHFYFQKKSPSIRLPPEKKPFIVMDEDKVSHFSSIMEETAGNSANMHTERSFEKAA